MIDITFSGNPDAIICLNSTLPSIEILEQFAAIPIIAADGAANKLLDINVIPNFIVGDLDSFNSEKYSNLIPQSHIIHLPEQDTNDFEKNIVFAKSRNWQKLLIFGIHGGELEHTLNNWSIIRKFTNQIQLLIYDIGRYSFPIAKGSYKIHANKDEIISLIPQCSCKLSTKGLKWELNNEILEIGSREGARNRAIEDKFIINIEDGQLLVSMESRLPYFLNMKKIDN